MSSMLENEVQYLSGIGPKRAQLMLQEMHVHTWDDLLHYFPFRYIDRTRFHAVSSLQEDAAYVQLRGYVKDMKLVGPTPRKQRLVVQFYDATGSIDLVFFKGVRWMQTKLRTDTEYIVFGKPSIFMGHLNLVHPEIDPARDQSLQGSAGMQAVYPSTENLKNAGFTNKVLANLVATVLEKCQASLEDTLPAYLVKKLRLMPLALALEHIHFPKDLPSLQAAKTRLKFEELFYIQLGLLRAKSVRMRAESGLRCPRIGSGFNACYQALPFPLTGAQKRVVKEIRSDLGSGKQMNRLLQGDVGSGKTLVALLSALIAIDNGYQVCIMAPTEILARQHFATISGYLKGSSVTAGILTGTTKAKERESLHAALANGSMNLLVGTHALIEDKVQFAKLGFVIIDEQHRFGVEQRAKLWSKAPLPPHVLVMTATPIPRTLAMTLYGDLDVSVIDELPPGRRPVQTVHFPAAHRDRVFAFMRDQIKEGRQIYMVYPLIQESEALDYENLETGYEEIVRAFPAPQYVTAVCHGKLKPDEKDMGMQSFIHGQAHIMVATSVIEVGVDVPNASVMVIESAERFGLSQLHQLRGRVGRGANQSYCILLTGQKLSKEAKARIELMCQTNNGFEIADADMKLRGPGDLEGTAQSGLAFDLRIANLAKDGEILEWARDEAQKVLETDPQLEMPRHAILNRVMASLSNTIRDYSTIS